ncbi:MAG: DHH family phosphoesterase [Thaumarchaeota archaeon]|nr:DHH family phosphoesterase [Nitrososphaerota archaeon]
MSKSAYFDDLRETAKRIRGSPLNAIVIFHDDADGLCAGAIASLALERLGIKQRPICVEKLSPEIVKLIHSLGEALYIYVDIGSGRADLIAEEIGRSGGEAIIADHHDPVKVESEKLIHLNPEFYGYSGETDVSGSTATYLLMREAADIKDAAWMAIIGSAEIPGPLKGLNRIALEDAVEVGDIEVLGSGESEKYVIKFLKKPWNKLSSTLTAIGSMGYYEGAPLSAIENLKQRRIPEDLAEKFEALRKKKFAQAFAIVSKRGLNSGNFVQWYHLGDLFKGLGSKAVGTFTSMLSYRRVVNPQKYLIGFMNFLPDIPGLGRIEGEWVKTSVRVPKQLSDHIKRGTMPPVSTLTIKASEAVDGSGDGHSFAASALIPAGKERDFIREFDGLVEEFRSRRRP